MLQGVPYSLTDSDLKCKIIDEKDKEVGSADSWVHDDGKKLTVVSVMCITSFVHQGEYMYEADQHAWKPGKYLFLNSNAILKPDRLHPHCYPY